MALLPVFIALTKKRNKPSAQKRRYQYACVAGSGNGLIREKLVRKSGHRASLNKVVIFLAEGKTKKKFVNGYITNNWEGRGRIIIILF